MKTSIARRHRHPILGVFLSLTLLAGLFIHAQFSNTSPYNGAKDPDTGKPIVTLPDGLKYIDLMEGKGTIPKAGDTVSVNYVGKLLDGTVFDASAKHGGPFTYQHQITSLIKGWTEGVNTMKQGGKRKLIIPPDLGYGFEGSGNVIPPNATLIFEIELVDVKPLAP